VKPYFKNNLEQQQQQKKQIKKINEVQDDL